ncbi:MAG: limonene-1,2-epoxide hydrolase family protein [Nevskia sp.]
MSPLETVERFIATWRLPGSFASDAVLARYFTPDCRYENIGLSDTTGPAQALAFFEAFAQQTGFASIDVEMIAIAAQGDAVLTERVDHLKDGKGKRIATIPLMGIFRIRDGRIFEWRDYFDTAALAKTLSA